MLRWPFQLWQVRTWFALPHMQHHPWSMARQSRDVHSCGGVPASTPCASTTPARRLGTNVNATSSGEDTKQSSGSFVHTDRGLREGVDPRCGREQPMRLPNRQLLRCYASMVLDVVYVGLGVLQYGVRSMQTRILQPPLTKQNSGSTVTLVGFMTMPSDSSE